MEINKLIYYTTVISRTTLLLVSSGPRITEKCNVMKAMTVEILVAFKLNKHIKGLSRIFLRVSSERHDQIFYHMSAKKYLFTFIHCSK